RTHVTGREHGDASQHDEVDRCRGERLNQPTEVGCHALATLPPRSRRDVAAARGAPWGRDAMPPRAGRCRLQGPPGRATRTATPDRRGPRASTRHYRRDPRESRAAYVTIRTSSRGAPR